MNFKYSVEITKTFLENQKQTCYVYLTNNKNFVQDFIRDHDFSINHGSSQNWINWSESTTGATNYDLVLREQPIGLVCTYVPMFTYKTIKMTQDMFTEKHRDYCFIDSELRSMLSKI